MTEEIQTIIDAAPLKKLWLAADAKTPLQWDKTNKALANAIANGALQDRLEGVLQKLEGNEKSILLVTDVEAIHPYLRRFEDAVIQGQASLRAVQPLLQEGWSPDWIISHVGFGSGLYLSDVYPDARRIGFFEWYYNSSNSDVDFLKPGPIERDQALRLRTWNAQTLLELADCDFGVVPTQFQLQQFPDHLTSNLVFWSQFWLPCGVVEKFSLGGLRENFFAASSR